MATNTFGFMDGSQYDVSGNQVAAPTAPVTRYTSPTPTATPPVNPSPTPVINTVAKPTLGTVDENQIREQTRQRMQSSIDAINANYTNLIRQEQVQGEDRSGQTRAINARSGLMGSDFGVANAEKTTQFNKQQQQYLVDQQNAQVNSVMQNIEDRASSEIQKRKDEALGKYQMDTAEFEKAQEQARGDFELLAKSGADLNAMSPAQKSALFKQAGYDDTWGDLIYNAMKPKLKQIDYKFEKLADGRGMFYGTDPVTGQLVTKNVEMDLPPDWQVQIAPDGTVLGFDKNTGQARVLSGIGEFAKPEDPFDQAYKQAQIDKIYSDIANGQGDGLLSVEESNKLGVPYGTTKSQAVGVIPGSAEKIQAAQTSLTNIQTVLDLITKLQTHSGLDSATGTLRLRTAFPGSNARDFVAKFDQLKALLSLDNIKYLKGTGAISDAEQQLLANAASSLRRDIGTDDFVQELQRLGGSISSTQQKLQNVIEAGSGSLLDEFESQSSQPGDPDFVGPLPKDFNRVVSDTYTAPKTGMRTDRHNNPTAFTTDIAKMAGLKLGVDYEVGDAFPNNSKLKTARILKDPVATTIKVIDTIGFNTQSGKPRWTYTNSIPETKRWNSLSYSQKKNVVKQMYAHEGGKALLKNFA